MTVDLRKFREADNHIIDSGDDPVDTSFVGENDGLEDWTEADSHIMDLDDPSKESDSFMGSAEEELAIWDAFQKDEAMPSAIEQISDDELAIQYGLDAGFESGVSEEIEDAEAVIREEERNLMMRDAARHEAQLLGLEEEASDDLESLSFFETDLDMLDHPCEGVFLPWDDWMRDVSDRIEALDKWLFENCEKFDREAFSEQIREFMLSALRTKVIEEKFGGEFKPGLYGEERIFFGLNKNLWDEFIDELCVARLDLRRQEWAEFEEKQIPRWLEYAVWDRDFTVGGEDFKYFAIDVSSKLKTEELKRLFEAEIHYNREKDAIESSLHRGWVEAPLYVFAQKLNSLKSDYLREKEERERRQAEKEAEEERKRLEAERKASEERARHEAERKAKEEQEKLKKAEAERKAKEEEEKRKKAEAERKARKEEQKKEETQRLRADHVAHELEITRLRSEWSDADLEMEVRIMAMKAELAPHEADLARCEFEYDSVMARFNRELKRRCAEEDCHYWSKKEESGVEHGNLGYYEFCQIRKKVWPQYDAEASGWKARVESLKEKCAELREDVAHEERKRGIQEKMYEARLQVLGASLDPSKMRSFSGLEDIRKSDREASPDTVFPGLPLGMVGCLAGPGGRGKTQLMTQISFDVACGRNGLTKGAVLFVSGEDNREFLTLRRAETLKRMSPKFSESELSDISVNFIPWFMDGMRADLTDSQSENTRAFTRNLRLIERDIRKKDIQLRLIVLDTLSNFNAGKENLSEQASDMLDALQRICVQTGASLIFIHHTTKASGSAGDSGADGVRGHSILANNVKWVTILGGMTEKEAANLGVSPEALPNYVKTTLVKCNYLTRQEPEWFRNENGVFVPAELEKPSAAAAEKPQLAKTVSSSPASKTEADPVKPEIGESGHVAFGGSRFQRQRMCSMALRKTVKTVRIERSIFSVKSLFAEYPKGAKKARGTMFFEFGEDRKLEVRSMSMGAFHLLVLEALIAEAQAGLDWQTPTGPEPIDRDMREMMKLRDNAARSDNLTVTLSYYAIAVSMGRRPDTRLKRQIDEALIDLAGTQFIWRKADGRPIESYHLLSYMKFSPDSEKGPVKVSICPALSEVIKAARPYARVDMDEVRSLEHKVNVLVHGWLSSIISPGQTTAINIDTILQDVIWAQKVEKGSSTYRTRRSTLMNKLLPDLENAGWEWD